MFFVSTERRVLANTKGSAGGQLEVSGKMEHANP